MPFLVLLAVVVVASIALLACAVVARSRATRLPRSLVVEYTPRQSKRAPDVVDDAILLGRERRAVAAGLLQLATAGAVRLVAEESERGRTAIGVELADGGRIGRRDTALLAALFGPDHPRDRVRRFSRDRRQVGREVRAFVDERAEALVERGLLRAPRFRARYAIRVWSWILLPIAVLFAVVLLLAQVWELGAAAVVATVALIATLVVVPRGERRVPTDAALPRLTHLEGLRQYMTLAEADRIRFLQSPRGAELRPAHPDGAAAFALDERLLPYAVVFGIEAAWLAHLKISYAELDGTSLAALGDVAAGATDLLQVADVLGGLVDIGFAVGDLVASSGEVLEVVGGVFETIGDLTP